MGALPPSHSKGEVREGVFGKFIIKLAINLPPLPGPSLKMFHECCTVTVVILWGAQISNFSYKLQLKPLIWVPPHFL